MRDKEVLLEREERLLSVLRWIAEAIPEHNRWYPVFRRYLEEVGRRVTAFGGDPTRILPSPTGEGRLKRPREEPEKRRVFTGKITGLLFDHFGDFEGFLVETDERQQRFLSREKEIADLAERAWRERLRVSVRIELDDPQRPRTMIIRQPPRPFEH